jgi:hypothetical protein
MAAASQEVKSVTAGTQQQERKKQKLASKIHENRGTCAALSVPHVKGKVHLRQHCP